MVMNWEIRDETGCIESGTQEEIQLKWDLMTRSLRDLSNEYKGTYTYKMLKELKKECLDTWEGDIELLEVHAIYR
jgi:hypothetical protein